MAVSYVLASIAVAGAVAYIAGHYRILGRYRDWVLSAYAASLGGTWFIDPAMCFGCGRRRHVLIQCPDVMEAELPGDTGYRCLVCAEGARS